MKPHFYMDRGMWSVRLDDGMVYPLCWESPWIGYAFDRLMRYTICRSPI